jgi:LacI family transcriptional regulator
MTRRPATLAVVAKAAGVSRMTASRALNGRSGVSEEVRARIVQLASEMGYTLNRTAQKLSGGKSRVIGLVSVQMYSQFVSEVVTGALRAARAAGYEMLLYSLIDPADPLPGGVTQLLGQVADGVIALLPFTHDYLEELAAARVPVVTVEDAIEHVDHPCVLSDNYQGAQAAVRHLVELGHRRIGLIAGNERLRSAVERRRAYNDVLGERGLSRDPTLVVRGDYTERGGFEAARKLLALPRPPTAIFAANDQSALGALSAAQALGLRVPRDLSLVGFDDVPQSAQIQPPLTTVRQPMETMGRAAVNTLLALLAGLPAPSPILTLPTELVVRASTAPPRAAKRVR